MSVQGRCVLDPGKHWELDRGSLCIFPTLLEEPDKYNYFSPYNELQVGERASICYGGGAVEVGGII